MDNTYFESATTNGNIQISDTTKMYRLKSVEKLQGYYQHSSDYIFDDTDAGNGNHTGYFYKITSDNENQDLYFIRNPLNKFLGLWTAYTCIEYTTTSPYTSHYYKAMRGWWVCVHNCTREEADSLLVYRFTTDIPDIDSHVGLEVFDKNGSKVFSSDGIPLKICNFSQLVHTTDQEVGWTGNWSMQQPSYNYQNAFAVWMTQQGGGGSNGEAFGHTKYSHFWLNNTSVKVAWLTKWENEHSNVKDKYWFWTSMRKISPNTQYVIADVSGILNY